MGKFGKYPDGPIVDIIGYKVYKKWSEDGSLSPMLWAAELSLLKVYSSVCTCPQVLHVSTSIHK